METGFRALLTSSAEVSALAPADRIVWGMLGQGKALPAAVLNAVSNNQGMTQQGPDGLWQGRVQVDCYGLTYAAAKELADAVIKILNGYRDANFRLIVFDARRDHNETGATDRPHRISLDFLTNWRAS